MSKQSNLVNNSQDVTVDASGNVGIGYSSPAGNYGKNLQVHTAATSGSSLQLTDGTTGGGVNDGFQLICTNGLAYLWNRETSDMVLATSNTERMRIDSSGAVTMPAQPAFQVNPSSNQTNIATDNSEVTVVFGTEVFDQNADFASNTFTAPVTGKYQLNASLYLLNIDSAADYYILKIKTSNRDYTIVLDPGRFSGDVVYWPMGFSVLADMDASDTATIVIQQNGGTAQTDIHTQSKYSGHLVA